MHPKKYSYLLAESDAHDDGAGREDDGGEEDGGLAPEALAKGPGHQREQPCRTDLQIARVVHRYFGQFEVIEA